ncbi:MAG: oligosaccharide flippase family protein [Thermoanaerobaculia bacterium]
MAFLRNALSVLATAAFQVPVALATGVVLARCLPVAEVGHYSVVLAFVGIAVILSRLGWPMASIYRLRGLRSPAAVVAGATALAWLALTLIAVIACLALEDWVRGHLLHGAPRSAYLLGVLVIPWQLLGELGSGIARALDRFDLHNSYRLGRDLGRLAALAVVLIGGDGGLLAALWAVLISQAASALVLAARVLRRTGLDFADTLPECWAHVVFGIKSYLQGAAGEIHERVDLFMLAYLLTDPAPVAIYAIAANGVRFVKQLAVSINLALYPQLASLDDGESARLASDVARHSLTLLSAVAVALGLAAPLLLPALYGSTYSASLEPFLILLPGMVLLTLYRVFGGYFTSRGKQGINAATQVVSCIVNVGLNLWLIPRSGIAGAAVASLISYTLETLLIAAAFRRRTQLGLVAMLVPRRGDLALYRRLAVDWLRRRAWTS